MAFSISELKRHFNSGKTHSLEHRLDALAKLENALKNSESKLLSALQADLGKSPAQTFLSELGMIYHEISFTTRKLARWSRPQKVRTPLYLLPGRSRIILEPRGVVLIIGAWNYPLQLTLVPLIGALAAGNCAVVKPSELCPKTSSLLRELLEETFPRELVQVVEGGVEPTTALLKEHFDLIFFTGSTAVGRVVAEAAAKTLTPAILELGGKSPAVVCADANLKIAARRLCWGKFMNAGQTCVAPDFLFLHESVREEFLVVFKIALQELYETGKSSEYGRIVNQKHFDRLSSLLSGGKILFGGSSNREKLFIEPTLLTDVKLDHPLMKEEIFGPLLPILEFKNLDDVFQQLQQQEKPLAAYIFTESKQTAELFLKKCQFGGGCVNDTIIHLSNPYLPFGGVGQSGIGAYHGETSFRTFSHQKSVFMQSTRMDPPLRYPPYSEKKLSIIRRVFNLSRWL